jgi:glycosyltransferase involved in cell wall biosynthesis
MAKIVMVVPACPAAFGDTAARWFDVAIRELVRRGHHVDLICVTGESAARVRDSRRALLEVPGPGTLDATFHPLVISRSTLQRKVANTFRPFSEIEQADGVKRVLDTRLARGCDVLHVEQLWSGWLSAGVARSLLNVHHLEVIDNEDEPIAGWEDRKARWQMQRATAAILRQTANVRFFTTRLSARARQYNAAARHWVLPFALDASHYAPVSPPADPVVGLIGSMQWRPSRGAAERLITRIWPLVRALAPDARLIVGGWKADRYLSAYADTPGLELRSDVPHPRGFFSDISVMAYAPRRGSGMKIKVMEAMAFGVPVVTTSEGVEGLAVEPGIHAHVADDDHDIAARIVDILRHRDAARSMAAAGRALIAELYNPRVVVDGLVNIYEEVAAG